MSDEKELKDQRIPIMMTAAEVEAIDEWSFSNRIRSRGEAIRRLCKIGIHQEADLKSVISLISVAGDWLEKGRVWTSEEHGASHDEANKNQPAAPSRQANFIASMALLAAGNAAAKIKERSDVLKTYGSIEEAFKQALEKSDRAQNTDKFLADFIDEWKSIFAKKNL
ncbi:hypothetical protein [Shinella sp.]|uniref:hypothetical protein n=1 Tax=Shinella sp. TaxID=1870904 RepID=UPI003D2D0CA5